MSPLLTNTNLGVKILTHSTNSDPCNLGLVLVLGGLGEWGVVGGELVVPEDGVGGEEETPGDRLGCSLGRVVC